MILIEIVGSRLYCLHITRCFVLLGPEFNTIIRRLVNSCLLSYWLVDYMCQWKLLHSDEIVEIESVMTFSMYERGGEFSLLLIGFVLTSLAFAIELFFHLLLLWFDVSTISLHRVRLL